MKRIRKLTIITGIVLVLIVLLVASCASFDFRMKPENVKAFFDTRGLTPEYHDFDFEGRNMHYVAVGDKTKPLVLFVHGSPGSWDAFISYMGNDELLERARIASVDRPGFGESGFGEPERSMQKQAAAIAKIIEDHPNQPVVLVGHSLGGPVIARMAMDYPDQIDGLIFVAASIDPELEKTKWYQVPADWKLLSWMVPTVLLTTNREILPLKGELELMVPMWKDITMPVTVIQGGKDKLVPAGNADFAERMLTSTDPEMVIVPELNHFVPWNRPDLIKNAITKHLDDLEKLPTN